MAIFHCLLELMVYFKRKLLLYANTEINIFKIIPKTLEERNVNLVMLNN